MNYTHGDSARRAALEQRKRILEGELSSVERELDELKERYIQVVFLIGPDSPEWAENFKDKEYTYSDPSRSAVIGDLVIAGGLEGVAQVVGIGPGNVPAYRRIDPIIAILERREVT